jgi:hypothetical protein
MDKVETIKQWAEENYDDGGHWIIETLTDDEIRQEFNTVQDAIDWAKRIQDHYLDISNA